MRRKVALTILILAVAPWAAAFDGEAAQAYLDEVVAEHELPGISAAVGVNNELAWSGGAGFADIENQVPAKGDMVHRIASISKPITAIAVMQLVEQGKVKLDEPISTYVASYPAKPWPVTVRQVLNHTSGTRHYVPGEFGTMEHYPRLRHAMRVFVDDDLLFEPGTKFSYSTHAYTLLGEIIEREGAAQFGRYMQEHLWGPAGMNDTRLEENGEIVPRRARGYSRNQMGVLVNGAYDDLSVKYPGGGMLSSAEDLIRLSNAFNTRKLVDTETHEQMITPGTLNDGSLTSYGLGWGVEDTEHGKAYFHSGGQIGTDTYLVCYYEEGISVAVIVNWDVETEATRKVADKFVELVIVERALAN